MEKFECKVYQVKLKEHPNADSLELAQIGTKTAVVKKGEYKEGDLAVFLPPGAQLPYGVLKKLGLDGKLGGKERNIVYPVKIRGQQSEGILYSAQGKKWAIGQDVRKELGIGFCQVKASSRSYGNNKLCACIWNKHPLYCKCEI